MKYVRCKPHFKRWEQIVGRPMNFAELLHNFRAGDQYDGQPVILDLKTPNGLWMERAKMRALTLDAWRICPYCNKPCWHRHWARMETLSEHINGEHRQYHIRCKAGK